MKTAIGILTVLLAYGLGWMIGKSAGYRDRMRDEYWATRQEDDL